MNEDESVAMWERYGRSHLGLAIRSTVQRLVDALTEAPQDVFVSAVSYIDYDRVIMPLHNALYPLLHKRRSYSYEHELRAVTMFPTRKGTHDHRDNPPGILVPVDVVRLVEAVYVTPSAPDWLLDTVSRSVVATLGVELPVRRSPLGAEPLF